MELTKNNVIQFLTVRERQTLRMICRRWYFTCTFLQYDSELPVRTKSQLNLESRRFKHGWRQFINNECTIFLSCLLQYLPLASKEATYALRMGLCASTNTGVRPSFDNASARTGYLVNKINRCGNLPSLLLTREMADLRSELFATSTKKKFQFALYGGGPGYDSIGFLILSKYLRIDGIEVHTNVYDNELGWSDAVTGAEQVLHKLGYLRSTWSLKFCDITEPISSVANKLVGSDIPFTDLFIFSFVCVENFCLLHDSNYVFFKALFASAPIGSHFIFTDSTHRLWPTLYEVASSIATFRVWVPHSRSHYALVLRKLHHVQNPANYPFYTQAQDKLAIFSYHHKRQPVVTTNVTI